MDYEQKVCLHCWKKRLDLTIMLNLLLALGSLKRGRSSAWYSPAFYLPACTHMHTLSSYSLPSSLSHSLLPLSSLPFIISHIKLYFSGSLWSLLSLTLPFFLTSLPSFLPPLNVHSFSNSISFHKPPLSS